MKNFLLKVSFVALSLVGLSQTVRAIVPDLKEYGSQNRKQSASCVFQILKAAASEGRIEIKLKDGAVYEIQASAEEHAKLLEIKNALGGFSKKKRVAAAFTKEQLNLSHEGIELTLTYKRADSTSLSASFLLGTAEQLKEAENRRIEVARLIKMQEKAPRNSLLGIPMEAREHIVDQLHYSLNELLLMRRDLPLDLREVLPDCGVLAETIERQFYQTVQNLIDDAETVDDAIARHASKLMEVLRALYDHTYYNISNEEYKRIIARLKRNELWRQGGSVLSMRMLIVR